MNLLIENVTPVSFQTNKVQGCLGWEGELEWFKVSKILYLIMIHRNVCCVLFKLLYYLRLFGELVFYAFGAAVLKHPPEQHVT